MLFAALCYSASTVCIPAWAVRRRVPSLHLALGKSAFLAAVSAAALAAQAWQLAASGCAAEQLWPGWRQSAAGWALITWSALRPGALAAFLHVKVGGSGALTHALPPLPLGKGRPGAAPSVCCTAAADLWAHRMTARRLIAPAAVVPHMHLQTMPARLVLSATGTDARVSDHSPSCVLQRAALVCPSGGCRAAGRTSGAPHIAGRLPHCSRRSGRRGCAARPLAAALMPLTYVGQGSITSCMHVYPAAALGSGLLWICSQLLSGVPCHNETHRLVRATGS